MDGWGILKECQLFVKCQRMVICWHRAKIEIFLETLEKLLCTSQVLSHNFWQFKTSTGFFTSRTEWGACKKPVLVENCQKIWLKTRLVHSNFSRVSRKISILARCQQITIIGAYYPSECLWKNSNNFFRETSNLFDFFLIHFCGAI